MTLDASKKYMLEVHHNMVKEAIASELRVLRFNRTVGSIGKFVRLRRFIYIFEFLEHRRFSDAQKYKAFSRVRGSHLIIPPKFEEPITTNEFMSLFEVDEREGSRIEMLTAKSNLEVAKLELQIAEVEVENARLRCLLENTDAAKDAVTLHAEKMIEKRAEVNIIEMSLQSIKSGSCDASIDPHPETKLRDSFYKLLQSKELKNIVCLKEKRLDTAYTMFQGVVDVALLHVNAAEIDMTQPQHACIEFNTTSGYEEQEEEEEECYIGAGVECKRLTDQATQQALAGCHSLLADLIAINLRLGVIVSRTIGFAIELKRGAVRVHELDINFEKHYTNVRTYEDASTVGKVVAVVNHTLTQLNRGI